MNSELARIFHEISIYLDMQGVQFRPRAYQKISEVIADLNEDLAQIYKRGGLDALQEISGIGEASAKKIEEYIKTGKIQMYEDLKKEMPISLSELVSVEGLGPKKIKHLYEKLGIKNLKDLEEAIKQGTVKGLEGFGTKTAERIQKGLGFAKTATRSILGYALPSIEKLKAKIEMIPGVEKVDIAGSTRRRRDTIGDIDFLVIAKKPDEVMDKFVKFGEVLEVAAKGSTKTSVKIITGMNSDVRVVPKESYGAALIYFTGSKAHNIALREIAIEKGYKLNEYGLYKGSKQIAGKTEEEIYEKLGLEYIPPEIREATGEIEAAMTGKLPKLVEYKDIQGDLQVQTDWTDGKNSIEEMALAAIKLGMKYIAITDHTKRLAFTGGLDEKRLMDQMKLIDKLNTKFKKRKIDFTILKGSECDIMEDGTLDLPDEILSRLDIVGASVHYKFDLPIEEQTKRIKRAMSNPNVDILFHPTGRKINRREPYPVDMDDIIKHAKATNTILEIDAYPDRADLKDEYIRKCVNLGVKMSIDSDAHSIRHLPFVEYGVYQARRGWAKKADIINTYSVEKMLSFLK